MAKKKINVPKKFHVKKGDKVAVISGANKGSQGVILHVDRKTYRAIVEGVNMVKKHQKPTETTEGGIIEQEAPLHISNLMIVDPKTGTPTRIGRRLEDGKLVRYAKKSGEILN